MHVLNLKPVDNLTVAFGGGEGAAVIPFKAKPLELSFP